MKKCLLIGKTNVGKTSFAISFAEYMGLSKINITFESSTGKIHQNEYTIGQAKNYLSDSTQYKTKSLQYFKINIPVGKGIKSFDILDTSGLCDGIHEDVEVRRGMSQTLSLIKEADIVLHMVDCSSCKKNLPNSLGEIDYQLAQLGHIKNNYVMLANKMDIPSSKEGLEFLRQEFPNHYIIPISAVLKRGFGEVRAYVTRIL